MEFLCLATVIFAVIFSSILVEANEPANLSPIRKQMTAKQQSMFYASELIVKYSGREKSIELLHVKDMLQHLGFTSEVGNGTLTSRANSSEEHAEGEKIECLNIDDILRSFGMDNKNILKKREIMYLSSAIVQQLDMGCLTDRTSSRDHLHRPGIDVRVNMSDRETFEKHHDHHDNHHDSHHDNHHENHHESHHDNHHDSHHESHHGNHHDHHHDSHNESHHGKHHESPHDSHHESHHGRHHENQRDENHDSDHDSNHDNRKPTGFSLHNHFMTIPSKVWGFSILAVIVISLVGLASVAIIPIMTKVFYNSLINFLVAMAIGALTGDAILHLIPHALSGDDHAHPDACQANHHSHDNEGAAHTNHAHSIWKGMCSLGGIISFFVMEKIITIISLRRKKIKTSPKKDKARESDNQSDSGKAVDAHMVAMKLSCHSDPDYQDCEELMFTESGTLSISEPANSDENRAHSKRSPDHSHQQRQDFHAHSHAHFGEMPNTVAAVAWMVIVGDGVHNLSDGLALGAAFSNSITGGISTSIAIFCHELPHEIGDFAVLLRAGMSVKQALVYNCVSSILCFIGMVIGVALGNIHQASLWIFACVAGIFIYIALVDMMPELMRAGVTKSENGFCRLFLHVVGMLFGAGIMAVIAMFEHELMNIIDI